jgi:hypothetical protein
MIADAGGCVGEVWSVVLERYRVMNYSLNAIYVGTQSTDKDKYSDTRLQM